ncbi:OmpA family protein [Phaeobacter marinintestinus]|uniref:OmpA family protein n=1 Tax=Falsiphaeobacter marinintestinus TaxID=1492905 RepID=UPI0011B526C3|nr:OmpA family protein [Phaeobacter marinintestinus]
MINFKAPIAAAVCGVFLLGACTPTNPANLDASADPNKNTKTGAIIGGLVGAGLGAVSNSSNKTAAVLGGAVVGAAAGGAIGNSLDQQEAELRQQLANQGITITNTGDRLIVSFPNDITFATDSYTVKSALTPELQTVAGVMVKYPKSTVQVIGHTDSDGDATYNLGLSQRRANAVADILQSNGVSYERLSVIGQGEAQPIASNLTPEGKAQNRRVEIVVIPKQSS